MKFLSRAFFAVFVLLAILVAVSNAERVTLALWPLPHVIEAPLWLVIVALLLVGNVVGFAIGWWASRHARRRAREGVRETERLSREVSELKAALAAQRPAAPAGIVAGSAPGPAPREQKAIERQSALVAPELLPPTRGRA
jgi:uncharacterized integral membrane protein